MLGAAHPWSGAQCRPIVGVPLVAWAARGLALCTRTTPPACCCGRRSSRGGGVVRSGLTGSSVEPAPLCRSVSRCVAEKHTQRKQETTTVLRTMCLKVYFFFPYGPTKCCFCQFSVTCLCSADSPFARSPTHPYQGAAAAGVRHGDPRIYVAQLHQRHHPEGHPQHPDRPPRAVALPAAAAGRGAWRAGMAAGRSWRC